MFLLRATGETARILFRPRNRANRRFKCSAGTKETIFEAESVSSIGGCPSNLTRDFCPAFSWSSNDFDHARETLFPREAVSTAGLSNWNLHIDVFGRVGERLCRPREEWNEGTVLSESLTLYRLLLAEDSSPSRICGDHGRLLNGGRERTRGISVGYSQRRIQIVSHWTRN